MARSHARILVTIWADPEWRALPRDAQWLYVLLVSQPQITHCGVLQIPRRGWAALSADEDNAEAIERATRILVERRFLVLDDDTDEILVRTFMRHDGVATGPPGTLKNALIAARSVVSPALRRALFLELSRLDQRAVASKGCDPRQEHPIVTLHETMRQLSPGYTPPDASPIDGIADAPPTDQRIRPIDGIDASIADGITDGYVDAPGVGVGEGVRSSVTDRSNQVSSVARASRTRARARSTPAALNAQARSATAVTIVNAYAATCRQRPVSTLLTQLGIQIDEHLRAGWSEDDLAGALALWGTKALGPGAFPGVAHEYANRRAAPARRSRTDDLVASVQALKAAPPTRPNPFASAGVIDMPDERPALRAIGGS